MNSKRLDFITGIETSAQPDAGTPTDPNDVLTLSFMDANYSKKRRITNTWASPYSCVAGTSIAHGLLSTEDDGTIYVKGTGGVDMSANPQVAAGTRDGQRLLIVGTSDTDNVYLEDGTGLSLPNGNRRLKNGSALELEWDNGQSLWRETFWNLVGDIT